MTILDTRPAAAPADPFAALDSFGADTDEMAARFAAVVADFTPAPAATCLGCGRRITAAASVARGYGEGCWRRARRRAALLAGSFSDRQVEQAVEAVEDGAIVPAETPRAWLVVSSKGDEVYQTDGAACDCPAGQSGRICWHLASVALVERAAA
ncbi:DUF6011 domain-containing protein [Pseudofrankia inefficax]|uniref:SWIM-type domain-containing protein n=1 Tax=Pseudofrankia inefficax (strain DSM 45817 / CECT 9037 / DDB 130130 / EuI1c) TaxID=298654 RepID=E3J670_PSEI1|nr:DUF6011 domain-containing protein [Pseudofrankia inefficax]ADP78361.1 hypothetical protein FraEuI1c_0275 [Pseudofrankia inefficax]